jgi:raffinose/stachyose/melibiose transport system permease protein
MTKALSSFFNHFYKTIINVIIALFSLSCIFPFAWMINSALKTNNEFMNDSIGLAQHPQFSNFINALQTGDFLRNFMNSLVLSLINVVLTMICSFIVAYFLSRYQFRFRNLLYLLFVAGMVIPVLSLLVPIFVQFKTLHLLDHWYTLILPYVAFSMPFSVIVLENYIQSIPRELDEAAYLEGCTTFQLLRYIMIPMCKPVLSIVVITAFINAWNEFPFSLVLINDEKYRTLSLGIRMFNSAHTVNYPLYIAALLISIIPVVTIYLLFSKRIMDGMTVGAVKG